MFEWVGVDEGVGGCWCWWGWGWSSVCVCVCVHGSGRGSGCGAEAERKRGEARRGEVIEGTGEGTVEGRGWQEGREASLVNGNQ